MSKPAPLGRGLNVLLPQTKNQSAYIPNLEVEKIVPNRYQPRLRIDPEKLEELASSIKASGVVEPLIVTKLDDDKYELIAGERRWRAAKLAGIERLPAVVKEASEQQMLELAIIENVQRQDLNPLEEALAFKHMLDNFGITSVELGEKIGFSSSNILNKVRLINLPMEVKEGLMENKISEGHAKTLLGLSNPDSIILAYNKVVTQHLSVRATEELVRRLNLGVKKTKTNAHILDGKTVLYEKNLKTYLNARNVRLTRTQRGGKIEIKFKNDEDLDNIMYKIGAI